MKNHLTISHCYTYRYPRDRGGGVANIGSGMGPPDATTTLCPHHRSASAAVRVPSGLEPGDATCAVRWACGMRGIEVKHKAKQGRVRRRCVRSARDTASL